MLNKYGLSHVCANREFENIEIYQKYNYHFPYLDMYQKKENLPEDERTDWCQTELCIQFPRSIEFFLRGTKEKNWEFKNLFEYLFWTKSHRPGFNYLFGYS